MGSGRQPSAEETELWRRATAGTVPLRRSAPPAPEAGEPACADAPAVSPAPRAGPRPQTALPTRHASSLPDIAPGVAPGLDKRTLARLRRGMIVPETQIDLHRCTQAEAHASLEQFVAASQRSGRRCILVITGKGFGSEGSVGILKTMVPRWLNEPPNRQRILALCHAAPADGGEGALYVLLRRLRDLNGV